MARSAFLSSTVLVLGALAAFHAVTNTAVFVAQPHQALTATPRSDWARVAGTAGTGAVLALLEQQQAIAAGKSDYDDRQGAAATVMIGVILFAVAITAVITYIGVQATK
mmetsp:Transcript_28816/g.55503  ORF Transcript_28816/g.55503 Transcript_28816/m.55503 type:complete len:109 (+) Transcript_28816:54-380(+)